MIHSIISNDVMFFDPEQIRPRHFKMYNNITFEMDGSRVVSIISTNPEDYIRYSYLLGKNLINNSVL